MTSDDDYDRETAVNWATERSSAAMVLLRSRLQDAGFKVANAVGDLRRGDRWVFTSYTAGEWYVSTQDRSDRSNPRHSVRFNDQMLIEKPDLLEETIRWVLDHEGVE